MAITSPFKKSSHSRGNSREEALSSSARPQRAPQQLQGHPYGRSQAPSPNSRTPSTRQAPYSSSRAPSGPLQKSNTVTSTASTGSSATASLAQQYDSDKQRLIKYCFSSQDSDGVLTDTYITHVRIIEDGAYPSARPPPTSAQSNKKPRILVLAVKKDGTVYLHKGRENSNGSFQIGRTWSLNELSMIKKESTESGFICTLGKDYYWETNSARERQVFITTFVRVYRKFKNGLVPQLVGWDLSIFGLDENSYRLSLNPEVKDNKASVAPQSSEHSTPVPIPGHSDSPRQERKISSSPKRSPPKKPMLPQSVPVVHASGPAVDPYTRRPSAPSSQGDTYTSLSRNQMASLTQAPDLYARKQSASSVNSRPVVVEQSQEYTLPETKPLHIGRPSTQSQSINQSQSAKQESPIDLEQDINEQIRRLRLDEPVEIKHKERSDSQGRRGDAPQKKYELALPSGYNDDLDRIDTHASQSVSIAQTIRSVEIVSHGRAQVDADEESSDEEDITALYHETSDQLESSVLESPKNPEPTLFPDTVEIDDNDSRDFSFENSYGNDEPSFEKVNVTPKVPNIVTEFPSTIKANAESDDEGVYEDLSATPARDTLSVPTVGRTRRRANTIESVMEVQETDRSSFDDIFDEINWDSTDDSETLTMKLMKELADTEYQTTKKLIKVCGSSTELRENTSQVLGECDKLTPLLNLFAVELSSFSSDIKHIEDQGQGLQVETINKKNLWKDLSTLLNTVSVDENSLNVLLSADLDRDLQHLEFVLSQLESAINAIRGDNKDDEDLGDMRALRERRSRYEVVIGQFIGKVASDLDKRFNNVLQGVKGNLNLKALAFCMSQLLVYAGITFFIRNTSDEAFYDLVSSWESRISPLYNNMITSLIEKVTKQVDGDLKFTLADPMAFESKMVVSTQKVSAFEAKQNKLKQKFGLSEPSTADSDTVSSVSIDHAIDVYTTSLQTVLDHVILQQDFLVKFFHMSSGETELSSYISSHPIELREALLNSSIGEIDFDRANARDLASSIGSSFEPGLDYLFKSIVQGLRNNQKDTPGVLLWIELFEKKYGSTNLEYLLGQFKKLSDRLTADWAKFVDIETKTIEKTTLAHRNMREVSMIVKNFCRLVSETEKTFAKTLAEYPVGGVIVTNLKTGKEVDLAYISFAKSILSNLNQEFGEKFSRFKLHDGSESKDRKNYLINLIQNSNWIIDSLSPLKLPSLSSILTEYQTVHNTSRGQYVALLIDHNFGKIASFVHEVTGLLSETAPKSVDPSKRNAYNKNTVSKLLAGYTTREVSRIVNGMRQEVVRHFQQGDESEIQRQLVDKIWSTLQAEFVSLTMSLEQIMERYYRDVEMRFTKKDIIAAFNASRITH